MKTKTDRAFEAAEAAIDKTEGYAEKVNTLADKYDRILEPISKKTGLSKTSLALIAVAVVGIGSAVLAAV